MTPAVGHFLIGAILIPISSSSSSSFSLLYYSKQLNPLDNWPEMQKRHKKLYSVLQYVKL